MKGKDKKKKTQTEAEAEVTKETTVDVEETKEAAEATENSENAEAPIEEEQVGKRHDPKDEQIRELQDKLIRNMAEFDNYRKRTDKEKSQMFDNGSGNAFEKMLPVLDDLERGLNALSEEEKATSYAQGMEMVYKKFVKVLDDAGVKAIEAIGKEFNPEFHNAVMQQPSEEYESGFVINELQKGYMYKEKVLRHSMVVVAE